MNDLEQRYENLKRKFIFADNSNRKLRIENGLLSQENLKLRQLVKSHSLEIGFKTNDLLLDIKNYLSVIYSVNLSEKRRTYDLIEARGVFYWLVKRYTSKTLKEIAGYVGNVDHATVLNGLRMIENLIFTDKVFCSKLKQYDEFVVKNILETPQTMNTNVEN